MTVSLPLSLCVFVCSELATAAPNHPYLKKQQEMSVVFDTQVRLSLFSSGCGFLSDFHTCVCVECVLCVQSQLYASKLKGGIPEKKGV